jgi:hypothetical protein
VVTLQALANNASPVEPKSVLPRVDLGDNAMKDLVKGRAGYLRTASRRDDHASIDETIDPVVDVRCTVPGVGAAKRGRDG